MHELIIIGAGPAGLTAGIYAGRYRIDSLILEKLGVGGQIVLSETIENFPGFPQPISTMELMERFKKQLDNSGVPIREGEATDILEAGGGSYVINTSAGSYETKSVIVASGASPRRLGIPGEEQFTGRGVSYCATCDGPLFKDKEVAVVGGGDRALEEALFLARYCRRVTLIHRRQELRASRIMQEKVAGEKKIELLLESVVEKISGGARVESLSVKNNKSSKVDDFKCNGVFIFVGIRPNTDFVKKLLHTDEAGFIMTDQESKTRREGVFACGDCCKKELYQVITASAEGATAASAAHRYLLKSK